jgi:hypothetical protein
LCFVLLRERNVYFEAPPTLVGMNVREGVG